MKKFKILLHDYIIVIALLAFSVLYIKFSTESVSAEPSNIEIESPKEDSIIILRDSLTEWQVFIMALIEVECERNPKAKSPGGAVGPFQITQSYISEINRVYKTNFMLQDAYNLDKALSMFEMMNDYHNPDRDINKAIKLHNPKAGNWYTKKVKQRMHAIEFNEEVRAKIIDLYNIY